MPAMRVGEGLGAKSSKIPLGRVRIVGSQSGRLPHPAPRWLSAGRARLGFSDGRGLTGLGFGEAMGCRMERACTPVASPTINRLATITNRLHLLAIQIDSALECLAPCKCCPGSSR